MLVEGYLCYVRSYVSNMMIYIRVGNLAKGIIDDIAACLFAYDKRLYIILSLNKAKSHIKNCRPCSATAAGLFLRFKSLQKNIISVCLM